MTEKVENKLVQDHEVTEEVAKENKASTSKRIKLETKSTNVYYGEKQVIKNIDIKIKEKSVTAFIGPS